MRQRGSSTPGDYAFSWERYIDFVLSGDDPEDE